MHITHFILIVSMPCCLLQIIQLVSIEEGTGTQEYLTTKLPMLASLPAHQGSRGDFVAPTEKPLQQYHCPCWHLYYLASPSPPLPNMVLIADDQGDLACNMVLITDDQGDLACQSLLCPSKCPVLFLLDGRIPKPIYSSENLLSWLCCCLQLHNKYSSPPVPWSPINTDFH